MQNGAMRKLGEGEVWRGGGVACELEGQRGKEKGEGGHEVH